MFGRRARVEPNAHTVPVTFRGPHPLAANLAASVDRTSALGLMGQSGTIRIGCHGNARASFRGDLGPLQSFGTAGARVSAFGRDAVNMRPPAPASRGLPGNTKIADSDSASRLLSLFARRS